VSLIQWEVISNRSRSLMSVTSLLEHRRSVIRVMGQRGVINKKDSGLWTCQEATRGILSMDQGIERRNGSHIFSIGPPCSS
jgi:hypothetical protein